MARANRVLDAGGKLVVPGLIDLHAHVFPYGSPIGIPADELVPFQTALTEPDRLRVLYRGQLLELGRGALDDTRRAILAPGTKRNAVRAKAAGYLLDALWRQSLKLLPACNRELSRMTLF